MDRNYSSISFIFLSFIAALLTGCSLVSTEIGLESEEKMSDYDFSVFTNVEITDVAIAALNEEQLAVLYQQARYAQAMTDADTGTMTEIVSANKTFTHMSGRQQTREEYFSDIADGHLQYFTVGIEKPVITVAENHATITYTSVLNANAYGARGTYRMEGTHHYEKQNESWIAINELEHE